MKILLIRLSSIGDILLTTPILRVLKTKLPNAEIHFLLKPQFRELLQYNPYVDQLIGYTPPLFKMIYSLPSYEVVLDLHNNFRSFFLRQRGKRWYTYPKVNGKKWLMVQIKYPYRIAHVVERYAAVLKPLNLTLDDEGLDFFFPPEYEERVFLKNYYAIGLSASYPTKKWPWEHYVEVINHTTLPVVLLGGPTEQEEAAQITHHVPDEKKVLNLTGKLSLLETGAWIKKAKLLITHDTGLMHMGAAVKTPMVTLWGNTVPEFGMTPYKPGKHILLENPFVPCRPCSKLGYRKCPKNHFLCMKSIKPYVVITTMRELMTGSDPSESAM